RPLRSRGHGHLLRGNRPSTDPDEERPGAEVPGRGVQRAAAAGAAAPAKAYTAFFAGRARYPRFTSRRSRQCAHYTRSAFTLRGLPAPGQHSAGPPERRDSHRGPPRLSGMITNRKLARAIADCGWAEFRRQLAYKCEWYGRRLVVIDRWYPSSKTCSACGYLL